MCNHRPQGLSVGMGERGEILSDFDTSLSVLGMVLAKSQPIYTKQAGHISQEVLSSKGYTLICK